MPFIPAVVGAALIGAGGATGAALLSKKGSDNINKTNQAAIQQQQPIVDQQLRLADEQAKMSRDVFNRSQPAFDEAFKYYSGLTKGDGPSLDSLVAPAANKINSQWDAAYRNILNNAHTRGGSLDRAMRYAAGGRAMSLSDLYGSASQFKHGLQQAGAQGLSALSGATGTGLSGLTGAGNTLANAANVLAQSQAAALAQQQQRAGAISGIGSILTRFLTTPGLFGSGGGSMDYSSGLFGGGTRSIIGDTGFSRIPNAVAGFNAE